MTKIQPTTQLSCVLLAAGCSSRMGKQNKLLIDINGQSLIRKTAKLLVNYGFEQIIVVLGHDAELIREQVKDLPVTLVENHQHQLGHMTSVHLGLQNITPSSAGIMICLADLVLLEDADLLALHLSFEQGKRSILVPQYQGNRGNPVILATRHLEAILEEDKQVGCRGFIKKNPQEVEFFQSTNDHVIFDLDTPDDISKLRNRISQPHTN